MIDYGFLTAPTHDQIMNIIDLYRRASWWSDERDDEELVRRIVTGSHCFLAVMEEKRVVGMGRTISDRAHDAYIQDVTVHPDYRHQGIGHEILDRLIERLRSDGMQWIGLIAGRNTHTFYRPMGFEDMPDSTPMLLKKKT
ncbi:MAG TPA: GNAT family N-acetyltransferase [Syntrophales bacterium]|jgi:spermidine synthase|nr:GNAT family N-acetyltransferase [Syntrophales bacterium]HQA81948.1 GNAT family N-acetyltransferase [Syntrophales bacterium]